MLEPAVLRGRDRYERTMEGWTDNSQDDALTHSVRISDADRSVELNVLALPSPTYEIREARCRVLAGPIASGVVAGVRTLAGARMVAGFTRRVAEATGTEPGAAIVVDAAIEVARLARQVTKVPRDRAERARAGAWECWQLDTTAWVDLPGSCFTYSEAGRALFGTRAVTTPMEPDLYSPRPRQERVFVRRKVLRVERRPATLQLWHSMHDNVHGFELSCEVERASGRIVRAEHATPRLPYMGICTEPQAKFAGLVGERIDEGLRKRLGTLLGGNGGCAQLYDLTADLVKLLLAP
jgi:Protein of unknown function (DUF2889)